MKKQTYKVLNMECPACAMRLEGLEDDLPGIQSICASYRKAELEVVFDEQTLEESALLAAAKKLGYDLIGD